MFVTSSARGIVVVGTDNCSDQFITALQVTPENEYGGGGRRRNRSVRLKA